MGRSNDPYQQMAMLAGLAALAGASFWCVFLQMVREYEFGFGHPYLAWNLFLAWVPLLLALWLVAAYRARSSSFELFALGALFVAVTLFLPDGVVGLVKKLKGRKA